MRPFLFFPMIRLGFACPFFTSFFSAPRRVRPACGR